MNKLIMSSVSRLGILALIYLVSTEAFVLKGCPDHQCVPIEQCPFLLHVLNIRPPGAHAAVKSAICGYNGFNAKVCCNSVNYVNSDAEVFDTLTPMDEPPAPSTTIAPPSPTPPTPPPRRRRRKHRGNKKSERRGAMRRQVRRRLFPEACGRPTASSRIYGGKKTSLGSYPWMVALTYHNEYFNMSEVRCSGTLINHQFVVTAAHCLDHRELRNWTITSIEVGEWDLSNDPDCDGISCAGRVISSEMEYYVLHPEYGKRSRLSNDIALIKLKTSISFNSYIQPLCLPPSRVSSSDLRIGHSVIVTGWGMTEHSVASVVLRAVTLKIANPYLCKGIFQNNFDVNGGQICIGGDANQDTCQGDSGSPVIKLGASGQYYLLAVTSYGSKICGRENYPAVYTSALHYVHWIKATIEGSYWNNKSKNNEI